MGEVNPQALTALGGLAILGKVAYGITADDGIPRVSCKSDHLLTKYCTAPTLFYEPLELNVRAQPSSPEAEINADHLHIGEQVSLSIFYFNRILSCIQLVGVALTDDNHPSSFFLRLSALLVILPTEFVYSSTVLISAR